LFQKEFTLSVAEVILVSR